MSTQPRTLFVYGTLRPGGRYWPNISALIEHYDPALLTGHDLWHLDDGYPAIVAGTGRVFGDLLYVKFGRERDLFGITDDIEQFTPHDEGSLYLRTSVTVARLRDPAGPPIPAETYVFNPAHKPYLVQHGHELPDGEWNRHPSDESE